MAAAGRGGPGALLLRVCQPLVAPARLDLLAVREAEAFYNAEGFRPFAGFRRSLLDDIYATGGRRVRIATYNLWTGRVRWPERLDAACEELARLGADVVALQEVAARASDDDGRDAATYLAERCSYGYVETRLYPNDPHEGLAFVSKQPLRAVEAGWDTGLEALANCGLRVRLSFGATEVAITNVHLD